MSTGNSVALLAAVIATGAGAAQQPVHARRTFHAHGTTSAGAGAATILVEVSNVAEPGTNDWLELGTITLVLATTASGDGFASDAPWRHVRGRVSAISGTDATVSLRMGA